MKSILFVLALMVPLIAGNLLTQQFNEFLVQHNKQYTGMEYERRLAIFKENLKLAEEHQRLDLSAEHGVTKFFDMSFEEWRATYLMEETLPAQYLAKNCLTKGMYLPNNANMIKLPDSLDWRNTPNVVTSVKDQGSCGSCWAFSTAASIEGALGMAGKPIGDLSPQWIVDCSKNCSTEIYNGNNITVCNQGCSGGWPWSAFVDVVREGIPTWDEYPYTARAGTCKQGPFDTKAAISDFICVTNEDGLSEDDLAAALAKYGPLSIAVNANYFQSYKSGVMDIANNACQTQYVNHAILLVGYGHDDDLDKDYWIVKNSWAESWGEKGYVRIVKGKDMCRIADGVSVPVL